MSQKDPGSARRRHSSRDGQYKQQRPKSLHLKNAAL
jgi:hypothetical protein